uniref:Zinc finger, CCHC-type n=1 Tax=Tanacetum cinerariifolium TaxID=118510 RepID=A0A699JKG1_TANCI|nr:zinc finger, CCHC-type [Tanacetum cinerariifolium]
MVANFSKMDKFEGVDFRRWQKKMHFLLSTMKVVYVLTTPILDDGDDATVKKSGKEPNGRMMTMCVVVSFSMDSDKPEGNNVVNPSVVNMVEHNNSTRCNDNKGKRKHHDNTRADPNKKAKPTCWKCGKTGHIKRYCKGVNFGATVHVGKDRCWFKTYESLHDGSILHMGNESTALVHGRCCVDLRIVVSECGDDVAIIKRCRHNLSSDGITDVTTASGRNRLKSDMEDSTL